MSTSSTPRWAPWAWPKSVARPIRADAPGRLELRPAILSNGAVGEREFLRLDGTDIVFPSGVSRDGRFVIFQRSAAGLPPWSLWALPLTADRKPISYKGVGPGGQPLRAAVTQRAMAGVLDQRIGQV